ncbi:TatD family hydrolase [Polaromonas sp.]|nr:TatD family hydrolase [Candidatus Saccharibacteria bacterium]
MEFVDTHCHIQSAGTNAGERSTAEAWAKRPDLTREILVTEAVTEGVSNVVCVGCDLADSQLAVDFVQSQVGAWASIGIHPHEASRYVDDEASWAEFAALAVSPKVVAIGECGLDFFYNHSVKADQIEMLNRQLALAQEHNLPLIFHVREAYDDFWPIFEKYPGLTGVLHSFTDTEANMRRAVELGLYIGVNGIATFAKNPEQIAMYKAIPLENLVLETDAPFLTPTPYRGTVNEPKHIVTVAKFLSQLHNVALPELAAAITANANNLFGLK